MYRKCKKTMITQNDEIFPRAYRPERILFGIPIQWSRLLMRLDTTGKEFLSYHKFWPLFWRSSGEREIPPQRDMTEFEILRLEVESPDPWMILINGSRYPSRERRMIMGGEPVKVSEATIPAKIYPEVSGTFPLVVFSPYQGQFLYVVKKALVLYVFIDHPLMPWENTWVALLEGPRLKCPDLLEAPLQAHLRRDIQHVMQGYNTESNNQVHTHMGKYKPGFADDRKIVTQCHIISVQNVMISPKYRTSFYL